MSQDKNNVVVIVMDTTRADHLSCYGYDRETTPFLDKLAEKGQKFENCYSQAPWTLPSHTSFFTGKYPSEHGKMRKRDTGKIDFETFPERVKDEGYKTIGISNNGFISSLYGFEQLFDEFYFNSPSEELLFPDDELFKNLKKGDTDWESKKQKYIGFIQKCITNRAPKSLINGLYYILTQKFRKKPRWGDSGSEFVETKVQNLDLDEEPFLLFVNYVEPHYPYMPPKKYARKWLENDLEDVYDVASTPPHKLIGSRDQEKAEIMKNLYDGSINYLDSQMERLYKQINKRTDRETIFIFTSDHGEYFGENKLWEHHGGVDEEVIHVPLIISGIDNRNIEEIVELRGLYDFISGISDGVPDDIESGNAISEYLGLDSQIPDNNFSELNRCMISLRDENCQRIFFENEDVAEEIESNMISLRDQKFDFLIRDIDI